METWTRPSTWLVFCVEICSANVEWCLIMLSDDLRFGVKPKYLADKMSGSIVHTSNLNPISTRIPCSYIEGPFRENYSLQLHYVCNYKMNLLAVVQYRYKPDSCCRVQKCNDIIEQS